MSPALVSWLVTGAVVPALVVAGAVMSSRHPRRSRTAQISFSAAAVILLVRMGWWLAFEARGVSGLSRVIVALAVVGVSGAWWIAAVSWARRP
ncbi:MAG: hypothetical protein HY700_01085 [Gemmatimonadetes bacterium]|nr:hypothetical protein [Gemmatimonadota bacterium]